MALQCPRTWEQVEAKCRHIRFGEITLRVKIAHGKPITIVYRPSETVEILTEKDPPIAAEQGALQE